MVEPKRQYESEISITPALKLRPRPQNPGKFTNEKSSTQDEQNQTNQVELILGIIERIKKL
jgi:hypothetical protein